MGEFTLPLVPDGVPVKGHAVATFNVPQLTSLVDADLDWEENQGQLLVHQQLPLILLPVQIGIDQRGELWHVKSRDRMAFHRHAIRHQRQGKLTHQLYGMYNSPARCRP